MPQKLSRLLVCGKTVARNFSRNCEPQRFQSARCILRAKHFDATLETCKTQKLSSGKLEQLNLSLSSAP